MLAWFGTIAVLGLLNAAGNPGVVAAVNPWYAVEFFSAHTGRAFLALGLGGAGGHRRGGAVRRHGALRGEADQRCLVRRGDAGVAAQLRRPGRPRPRQPGGGQQPVLPARPRVGAVPVDRAGHRRHHHRQPGVDLRCVLPDPPGRAAGLPPQDGCAPHVGHGLRPGLRPFGELVVARRLCRARGGVPDLGEPGRRLRGGRHRHHVHHQHPDRGLCPGALGMEQGEDTGGGGRVPGRRPGVPRRQPGQDPRRRLVPPPARRHPLRGDAHLAGRTRACGEGSPQRRATTECPGQQPGAQARAATDPGNGGLPLPQPRAGAAGLPRQSPPQRGGPRIRGVPRRPGGEHSPRAVPAARRSSTWAAGSSRSPCATGSWRSRMSRSSCAS